MPQTERMKTSVFIQSARLALQGLQRQVYILDQEVTPLHEELNDVLAMGCELLDQLELQAGLQSVVDARMAPAAGG